MYLLDIQRDEDIATYRFNNNEFDDLLNVIRVTQAKIHVCFGYKIIFYSDDE